MIRRAAAILDPRTPARRGRRRAFTLTEILVVIGVIVLIIALAVPAFDLIRGSRSTDAAENLVGAVLARARAEALESGGDRGVAFFLDPVTGRYTAALVRPATLQASVYSSGIAYRQFDVVVSGASPTRYFMALEDTNAGQGPPSGTYPAANQQWAETDGIAFDVLPGSDFVTLPVGVGIALIDNCLYQSSAGSPPLPPLPANRFDDAYLAVGVVLFDGGGRAVQRRFSLPGAGVIGRRLGLLINPIQLPGRDTFNIDDELTRGAQPGVNGMSDPRLSGLGVALYDLFAFQGRGFDNLDPQYLNQDYRGGPERAEEQWIDENAVQLLVNRFNGTLIRAE